MPIMPIMPTPDPTPPSPPAPSYRYVVGPSFAATFALLPGVVPTPPVDGVPPAVAKLDPAVSLGKVDDAAWTVEIAIPPYDLATSNRLMEIRAYLLPAALGAMVAIPATGPEWVASGFAYAIEDVSAYQGGANAVVNLPDVPPGKHIGQIVLGYEQ